MSSPHAEPPPERVEEVFHEALSLAADARAAYLDKACAGEESLRAMVEELLISAEAVPDHPVWRGTALFQEACAVALDATPTLDRYRVIGRLGAGGMGVVYRAERSDGAYRKQVAIKIVPGAAGDEKLLERFQRERFILAALDHPYIARLLDGGTTADGAPYIAMELAEGVAIDQFVKKENLPKRDLIELFRCICAAVSYAHRNLVVHQDLKPGNILVVRGPDGAAEPKVLDFGVAKLLGESGPATQTRALTPEYASPEQISGAPVTTASDVYSLGVLLYELIGGRRPYRATSGVADLASAICQEDPISPGPEFDSDLANIVLMALRKEPERRYTSAEQMSEDLRRYLGGYPVAARPDTRTYRMSKFVARNRIALGAAAAVVIAVAGGVAATVRQANIANRRFQDVRMLANSYLFEFHDAIEELPGSVKARQLVVKRGLEYLDRIAKERSGDLALTKELAAAYEKIGDVQGRADAPSLGDYAGAQASYARAADLNQEVLTRGKDEDAAFGLANAKTKAGRIFQVRGDVSEASKLVLASIETLEAYAPKSAKARELLPGTYAILGGIEGNPFYPNLGHPAKALDLYLKALDEYETLVRAHPGETVWLQRLGVRYHQVGQMQQAMANAKAAAAAYHRSLEINEEILRTNPHNVTTRSNVVVECSYLADMLAVDSPQEAEAFHRRALEMSRRLVEADPQNAQAKVTMAAALSSAGRTALLLSDRKRALALLNESIAIYEAVRKVNPSTPQTGRRTAFQFRSDVYIAQANHSAALADIRTQLEIDDTILKANPGDASAERNQAIAWAQTARIHMDLAKHGGGVAEWRQATAWLERAEAIYTAQQSRRTFIPQYQGSVETVSRLLAECRAALQ